MELVNLGKFREDLFHRLNVMPIELNSLKERTEDIPLLIDYFKKKISELNGVNEANIDTKNNELFTYDWPGNVRELRNLVERITILSINEREEDASICSSLTFVDLTTRISALFSFMACLRRSSDKEASIVMLKPMFSKERCACSASLSAISMFINSSTLAKYHA